MSKAMSKHYNYVNIVASFKIFSITEDRQKTDVTDQAVKSEYNPPLVSDNNGE